MTNAFSIVEAAALSHTGHHRRSNQDSWSYSVAAEVFAVCDGMGGVKGGETASRLAAEAFVEHLAAPPLEERTLPAVAEAVGAANQRVYTRAEREPELRGMGTTLVALVRLPNLSELELSEVEREQAAGLLEAPAPELPLAPGRGRLAVVHVGDSRCYRWRAGRLTPLTTDHSLVVEQQRLGLLTEEEAAASPMRHVITRALGTRAVAEPESVVIAAQPGDLYLLCSDGLTRELPDEAIAGVLGQAGSLEERNAALLAAALAAGGHDNVTMLLVEVAR